jgi:hypothetical protein
LNFFNFVILCDIFGCLLGLKIEKKSQALVAHTCNPSYSGGSDQQDGGSNSAQANNLQDPSLKKPFTQRTGGVAQSEDPEFKPQDHKKKKN